MNYNSLNPFCKGVNVPKLAYELSKFFYSLLLKSNVSVKSPNFQCWVVDFEKMIRVDRRSPDEIRNVLIWLFSQGNNISEYDNPQKLRKKYKQALDQSQKVDEVHEQKRKQILNFLDKLIIPNRIKFKTQKFQLQIHDSLTYKNHYISFADEKFERKVMAKAFHLGCHLKSVMAKDNDLTGVEFYKIKKTCKGTGDNSNRLKRGLK